MGGTVRANSDSSIISYLQRVVAKQWQVQVLARVLLPLLELEPQLEEQVLPRQVQALLQLGFLLVRLDLLQAQR